MLDFLIILNPRSLSLAKNKKRYESMIDYLNKSNYIYEVIKTTKAEDIVKCGYLAIEKSAKAVLPIGGDGTFYYCANGMMSHPNISKSKTMAIPMPFGTGRDNFYGWKKVYATENWAWLRPDLECERHTLGKYKDSVGNTGYYVGSCSLGLSTGVLKKREKLNYLKCIKYNPIAYSILALTEIVKYNANKITMHFNDDPSTALTKSYILMMVQKGRRIGGGMYFHNDIFNPKDTKINFCWMFDQGIIARILFIKNILSNNLKDGEGFLRDKVSTIHIKPEGDRELVQFDGELIELTGEFTLSVVDGILMPK